MGVLLSQDPENEPQVLHADGPGWGLGGFDYAIVRGAARVTPPTWQGTEVSPSVT